MKKYSLFIVLSCLGSYSFASGSFDDGLLEEQEALVRQMQEQNIGLSGRLDVLAELLDYTGDSLNRLVVDNPAIPDEFLEYVEVIIKCIDAMRNGPDANFGTARDRFIRLEHLALQWLEGNATFFDADLYERVERVLRLSLVAASGLKLGGQFCQIVGECCGGGCCAVQ
jgi:hypothetical protein